MHISLPGAAKSFVEIKQWEEALKNRDYLATIRNKKVIDGR
jgi:hypothetical protein